LQLVREIDDRARAVEVLALDAGRVEEIALEAVGVVRAGDAGDPALVTELARVAFAVAESPGHRRHGVSMSPLYHCEAPVRSYLDHGYRLPYRGRQVNPVGVTFDREGIRTVITQADADCSRAYRSPRSPLRSSRSACNGTPC